MGTTVIISDTERFVFMHNPKVGGMAFRTSLMTYETRENYFFEWKMNPVIGRTIDMAHITAFQLRNLYPEAFDSVRTYLKFGFVRNPYDRFFSALSQHLKLATPYLRTAVLNDPETFYRVANHFARNVLNPDKIDADHRLVHFRRQSAFFYLDGRIWVDRVFHLERAAEEVTDPIRGWLGAALDEKKNVTRQFAEGYDPARLSRPAIEAIDRFYALDFERFGYDRL